MSSLFLHIGWWWGGFANYDRYQTGAMVRVLGATVSRVVVVKRLTHYLLLRTRTEKDTTSR